MNILSGKPKFIRILAVPERSVGYEIVRGAVAVKVLDQYGNDFSCRIRVQALLMDGNGNKIAAGDYIVGSESEDVRPDVAEYNPDTGNAEFDKIRISTTERTRTYSLAFKTCKWYAVKPLCPSGEDADDALVVGPMKDVCKECLGQGLDACDEGHLLSSSVIYNISTNFEVIKISSLLLAQQLVLVPPLPHA